MFWRSFKSWRRLVGIEASASSHNLSGELSALGHGVRLMLAAYGKPYVKRQKNDAIDARRSAKLSTALNRDQTLKQLPAPSHANRLP
jgi:transposase